MATTRKLDIFAVLDALNAKNTTFYEKLTEEEVKAFVPLVVMRWMSGTPSAVQVYLINELLNPFVFALGNHKQLLWNLLIVCNSGIKQRYVWNPLPSKKTTNAPNAVRLIKEYHSYNTEDAVNVLPLLTRSNLIEMAEELGWQADEIAKIKKEVKSTEADEPPPKRKKDTSTLISF